MSAQTAYLVKFDESGQEGERWEITSSPLTVGRSKEVQVLLRSKKTSRMHCALLQQKNGEFTIEDLLSTNGTWVNGQRVELAILQPYDRIRIGEAEFVFKLGYKMQSVDGIQPRAGDSAVNTTKQRSPAGSPTAEGGDGKLLIQESVAKIAGQDFTRDGAKNGQG